MYREKNSLNHSPLFAYNSYIATIHLIFLFTSQYLFMCSTCVFVCVFPLHLTFLLFSASFISCCYSLVKIRGLRHPFIIMFIFRWKKQNFHDDILALYWGRRSHPISYYLNLGRIRIYVWWTNDKADLTYVCMYVCIHVFMWMCVCVSKTTSTLAPSMYTCLYSLCSQINQYDIKWHHTHSMNDT